MRIFKTIKTIASICLIILLSCNKEDDLSEVVVGIKLMDENGYEVENKAGVKVTLSRGQEIFSRTTNSIGESYFDNLSYGFFNVQLEKEGFISEFVEHELTNSENDSINVQAYTMHEIPNYRLSLDSIYIPDKNPSERIFGFGKISNQKGNVYIHYFSRLFVNDTPNVSKDNFLYYLYGYIRKEKINGDNFEIWITDLPNNGYFFPSGYDSLFVRIYPYAHTAKFLPLREEALGVPSDVFKWVVPE